MPYCPDCKYEYNSEILICSDCNKTLIAELPKPTVAAQAIDDSWVSVCRLETQIKSELARGALDSNNIPSMVLSSSFNLHGGGDQVSPLNAFSTSGGGEVVMVPKEFLQEASLVLEAILGDDFHSLEAN